MTRALLAAENFAQVQEILRDSGCGAGNAVSINMTFLNQEGNRLFHNIEVGPALGGVDESALSIFTASPGEHIFHCSYHSFGWVFKHFIPLILCFNIIFKYYEGNGQVYVMI